jgi:two-component system chemotaxis response regulator CheB
MVRPELVAIGTSLGGLNALSCLLRALPPDFAVPIVIVQHRGTSDSGLADLLQHETGFRIIEAEDKLPLEAATAYLAPPDYHLFVEQQGLLALSTEAPVRAARPSIDVLFETAADAYGPALLAVLLTGASTDGAAGVARVKARGGRVVVQDPSTAESHAMPSAAIAAAAVDYVVPLDNIAAYLVSLVEGSRV